MAYSHWSGPTVTFGFASSGGVTGGNPVAGPNIAYQGNALMNPRRGYNPGISTNPLTGPATFGAFYQNAPICIVDAVPSTLAANNIAASASIGSATTAVLVSASGAGITVGVSVTDINGNTVNNLLAIDGAYADLVVGQTALLDPTKTVQRAIRVVSAGNDSGITFTVVGYDIYGAKVTQVLTGANAGTATTTKTFKYILSVTTSGATAGAVTIGTTDVYGFALRSNRFEYMDINWNTAFITATTGYTVADNTSPATGTTGDVRGTYAVQSASDGTKKLMVMLYPQTSDMVNAVRGGSVVSLFGQNQV